jgi:fibronectin-binding autotransporter adhesin
MMKERRGGSPLAGLTVAAILLASTAGYVSALSRMFQSPLISEETESDFLGDDTSVAQAASQEKAATFQQSLGRTAAAWLINALPGYSSGSARELWYLSLDSSGDRLLGIETSGNYNAPVATTYAVFNPNLFSNLAPTASGFVGPKASTTTLAALDTATTEWTGATSTTWSTTTNWNPNTIPSTTLSAKFDTAFSNQPNLGAPQTAQGIWLATGVGQDVTITGTTSTRVLTITGTATLNGQTNAGIILDDSANHNLTIGTLTSVALSNDTGFYVNNAGTLSLPALNLNAKILTLGGTNASGTIALTGVISGTTGSLIVNTAGKVTLAASNTFTGGLTLTNGIVRTSTSANALGQGTLTLGGGELQLAHANSTSLNRPTTVTGNAQITSDGASAGSANNYTFGTLSIGPQTLTIAKGSNVTSGTAGVTFGATTLTDNATFSVGTGSQLTLGAVGDGGNVFGFTKSGVGTLILAGTDTNTGTTTISAGTLQAGNGATAGSLSGDVIDNASLVFNRTDTASYGGTISGTGSVTQLGGGTLTLSGNNSYNGGTFLSQANNILIIGNDTALGLGTLTISSTSTLQASGPRTLANNILLGGNTTISGSNPFTLNGTFTGSGSNTRTLTVNNTGGLTIAGNVFLAPDNTTARGLIVTGASDVTISGAIANNASGNSLASNFTKSGTNKVTLSGTNTYTGVTTITGGTLEFAKEVSLYNDTTASWTATNIIVQSGATAAFNVGGTGEFTSADIDILKGLSASATTGFESGSFLGLDTTNASGGTFTYSSGIANTNGGLNVLGVTKLGSGTLILSGNNSYSGLTTVSQGILQINSNNALGTTAAGTTVTNGAALKLNGVSYTTAEGLTLNGSGISNGGALTNTGTSSYAGAITLGTSSTINAGGGALTLSGGIAKNGVTLTLTGGGTITISTAGITGASPSSDLIVDGVTVNENVANSYNGATFIRNGGILNANVVNALPTANGRTALTMDDTGTGSSQLVLTANQSAASLTSPTSTSLINLNANTLTVGTSSGSTNFAGSIQGTGALIKDGASTQTLSGNNSYTGGTTISAGTITAGSATAIGNGALTFDNGSTGTFQLNGNNISVTDLVFNQTNTGSPIVENASATPATFTVNPNVSGVAFAGVLRDGSGGGALSLTINGGLLVLYNTNTYTGPTTINAGGLTFNSNTSPNISGSANNSTIFLGSFTTVNSPTATLTLGGNSPNTITSPITLLPSAGGTQGTRLFNSTAVSGTNTYGGILTMNTGLTLESSTGGTFLFQGGSINLKGNTLTVDSQANFNGADSAGVRGTIVINELLTTTNGSPGGLIKDGGGTLILQNVNNNYTGTSVFDVFSNTVATRIAGGTLGIYADTSLGLAPANPGADNIYFDPSAASNPTADHILQATGGDISLSARRQISVANGLTGTFDSNGNTFTVNGVIHGSGAIATTTGVNANGTVIFTNGNTYAGGTTVQSGTLLVNNPAATSGTGSGAVTVNSGGTLGGNGFINTGSNNVAINGTVDPGSAANTTGALTLTTASTVFGSTGIFHVDIGGSAFDQLLTSGTFDLTAIGDTISFNVTAPLTEGSYQLATFNGVALGIFDNANTPSGYTLVYNLGELDLIATPVPEPSTWIGAALALGAVVFTQRRRLRSYSPRRIRPSANRLSARRSS